jgi:peptide deformylase
MILNLVTGEKNPILRSIAKPIPKIDKNTKQLVKNLLATMLAEKGIGIAAPQVGESTRVFLAILGLNTNRERTVAFINPQITFFSEETNIKEEGCLSLPGEYGKVRRSNSVTIEYQDITGNNQVLNLSGMDARVVQHEYDHLEGVLFIDRI